MNKRILVVITVLVLITLYGLTYIPYKIFNINPNEVSVISVVDGNTGNKIEITESNDINYIINNLDNITFQKGKWAFGYAGYSFNTTIYNYNGEVIKNLIINSEDTIRFKGFFYKSKDNIIEYDYIKNLFNKY